MTIDYKALAKRLEMHAECHANVEPYDDEQRQWADDLRTVVSLLGGMADAKPDGEVVAGNGSLNDVAMIRWCSDYRPKIGDRIYAHPAPQPQRGPTEAQIEELHRLLEVVLHELDRLASPFATLQTIDVAGKRFIASLTAKDEK